MSEIKNWYKGRNVFITGATGFVGKSLVEKLLRDCPDIGYIYLMIRSKNGVSVEQRKRDYVNHVVFSRLKENYPAVLEKIRFIEGELSAPNLGISNSDIELISETVSVIFHSAATVKFDQPLITAYDSNVRGAQSLLDLATEFKQLDVSRISLYLKLCR